MKVVILAGGLGTRLSEETDLKPKPMVEVGGRPILWHIMKTYSHFGITEFVICCGYLGYVIKEYFVNYAYHMSDLDVSLGTGTTSIIQNYSEPWKVTLVDTGAKTGTGGRIKKILDYVRGDDEFCLTYGDGVGNVNIEQLIDFHRNSGSMVTLTAVRPPARFGALDFDSQGKVREFREKPSVGSGWINGGFFVVKPAALKLVRGDDVSWEDEPLATLAKRNQLSAFKHTGFWQPMDTLREKLFLNELWDSGKAPWKIWD